MGFEVLSEEVDWEARRVGAAFGVKEWDRGQGKHTFKAKYEDITLEWTLNSDEGISWMAGDSWLIAFKNKAEPCLVGFKNGRLMRVISSNVDVLNQLMARAVYHLGVEDEERLSQLPLLTAHEKLELRLSLPREFWPQKWLDENARNSPSD